jgi:long-chain acyl-CoA synthetase
MTIEEIIYQNSLNEPNKIAVISGEMALTYSDLWLKIEKVAAYFLLRTDIKAGDRIIISASKNVNFIYSYLGAHLAKLICVPIDTETNEVRLERIYNQSQPKLIIGELRDTKGYDVIPFTEVSSETKQEYSFPDETSIADLLFTTGTTGLPKGVALSYNNLLSAANNINSFIGNSSSDVELLALPISHSFGLGRLRCTLVQGATLVLLGSFASMKKFYNEIERCGVTGFGMVPASWAYIKKMSSERIAKYADQLKYIEIGSAFMPVEDKKLLMNLLPKTRICMHYGLTEASRSAFISFHDDIAHLNTVGKSSPNTEIEVYSEKGELLGPNKEGEICVKGNHVCSAYWGLPKSDFDNDFNGEFFKTGDWGYKSLDGYIYLKSRKKEIINVGGKKVSPIEVEEFINKIDGIQESVCIGVKDNVFGEVVKAFIVCDTGIKDTEIKEILNSQIENYKIPVYIEKTYEIPKTNSGKIQRLMLK